MDVKDCVKPILTTFPFLVIGVVLLLVYIYGICQKDIETCDPLNRTVFKIGDKSFSWWPISHFLLYAVWGYLRPDCWIFFTCVGVLWEIIEYVAGINLKSKIQTGTDVQYKNWMTGNLTDLIFNSLGLAFGMFLARMKGT